MCRQDAVLISKATELQGGQTRVTVTHVHYDSRPTVIITANNHSIGQCSSTESQKQTYIRRYNHYFNMAFTLYSELYNQLYEYTCGTFNQNLT